MSLILRRREFLVGLVSAAFAAPSIVRAANIMAVRAPLVAAPAFRETKRAWVVSGVDYSTNWNVPPGHPTHVRAKLRLTEVVFSGPLLDDIPITKLKRADVHNIDVQRFPEFINSAFDNGPPLCYERRPAEATIECSILCALSVSEHINKLVELE
jgi:hypothetical protein